MRKVFYAFAAASMIMASAAPTMAEETTAEAQTIVEGDEDSVEGIEALLQQLDKRIAELKVKLKELRGEQATEEGDVVYQDDNVIISFKDFSEGLMGVKANFVIENVSDTSYTVQVREASLNDFMVDLSCSAEVSAGKKANMDVSFMGDDLPTAEEIEKMQANFFVWYQSDTSKSYETEPVTMFFKAE